MRNCGLFLLSVGLLLPAAGCRTNPAVPGADAKAEQRAELEDQRTLLEQVPLPEKGKFMAIHSFDSWQNPYLTVQDGMVELHVLRGDANPSSYGVGGMFRPEAARRVELNVGMDKLDEAISSVPPDAWPYGRVVAIEEAHHVPANAEPAVRRNLEATISKLTELGVVVYDLNDGKTD